MKIKAKYLGKNRNFGVENHVPTIATLEELLNDRKHFLWDRTNVAIASNEINVEWDDMTDYYTFYEVHVFDAAGYCKESESINAYDFVEYEYVAVPKKDK